MHIRCFTIQGVTVLLLFWAPIPLSTYVQLSVVTSLRAVQCTYMPVTENITEHNACHVMEIEVNLMRWKTPLREASIQPWPIVQHVTGKKIQYHGTNHRPSLTAPHGAWICSARTLHCHRQTGQHVLYAHFFTICTHADQICVKRDLVPLPTPILIIVLCYVISI